MKRGTIGWTSLSRALSALAMSSLLGCVVAAPQPGGGGTPAPQTPTYLQLNAIVVKNIPSHKTGLVGWDGPLGADQADLFVSMGVGTDDLYVSNVVTNADHGRTYRFIDRYSVDWPGPLPATLDFSSQYTINVVDDDLSEIPVIGRNWLNNDDLIAEFRFSPRDLYAAGQGTSLQKELSSGGVTIQLEGEWIYQ